MTISFVTIHDYTLKGYRLILHRVYWLWREVATHESVLAMSNQLKLSLQPIMI